MGNRVMKKRKSKDKHAKVKVINETLTVSVVDKPFLLTLFDGREITAQGSALGPLGGVDLTGYSDYRLTLHFVGTPGSAFVIKELFGPAGAVDQLAFEVGSGQIGPQGILNYRSHFEIFGPKNFFIQVFNTGDEPFQVNGTLYAVR
jgi:hypothetical protein